MGITYVSIRYISPPPRQEVGQRDGRPEASGFSTLLDNSKRRVKLAT